jgi:hypothetical protein
VSQVHGLVSFLSCRPANAPVPGGKHLLDRQGNVAHLDAFMCSVQMLRSASCVVLSREISCRAVCACSRRPSCDCKEARGRQGRVRSYWSRSASFLCGRDARGRPADEATGSDAHCTHLETCKSIDGLFRCKDGPRPTGTDAMRRLGRLPATCCRWIVLPVD